MNNRLLFSIFILLLLQNLRPEPKALLPDTEPCRPGSGWRWVNGSPSAAEAGSVEQALLARGIRAGVRVGGYGEVDSCGTYRNYGYDYEIDVLANNWAGQTDSETVYAGVKAALLESAGTNIGNVRVNFPDQTSARTNGYELVSPAPEAGLEPESRSTEEDTSLSAGSFYRNVYVIVVDPMLKDGKSLIESMGWSDPDVITAQTIDFFKTASHGQLQYRVTAETIYQDGFLELVDGYRYTEDEYLAVLRRQAPEHDPWLVNYNTIVNMPEFDICGKANRGEIDEVWLYGAPYFGFYESAMVGPDAYWINGEVVSGPWTCERMIPIMAPSYERQLPEAVENFGHRSESTFHHTYRYQTDNNWERYSLVKSQSPGSPYSGCGNIHFPPNGVQDYDWSNPAYADTYCEDFLQYPDLPAPPNLQSVNCTTWNCIGVEYLSYWFSHLPHNSGCGPDSVSNLWWNYLAVPELANDPLDACERLAGISLNVGQGRAGSAFTVRGTGFPPNAAATVFVNTHPLAGSVQTDAFGNFVFILQTSSQLNPGLYEARVAGGSSSAAARLVIDPEAALVPVEGTAQTIQVPGDVGLCPGAFQGWKGEYWDNWTWSGSPLVCRDEPVLDFDWYGGSPDPLIPEDYFSARWTRTAAFEAGPYVFEIHHDDGARLFVDGTVIYENLCEPDNCVVTEYVRHIPGAGQHTIVFQVRENFGYAGASLDWSPAVGVAAPSDLTAKPVSKTQINLSWSDHCGEETNYRVERSPDGSANWIEIAVVGENVTTYQDNTCAPFRCTFYYRVRAYRSSDGAFSGYTNTAGATTFGPVDPPSNLGALAITPTRIDLAWQDHSSDESAFTIERSLSYSSGWMTVGSVGMNKTTYTDNNLECGTQYFYRIRAYRDIDGEYSAYSDVQTERTNHCLFLPAIFR